MKQNKKMTEILQVSKLAYLATFSRWIGLQLLAFLVRGTEWGKSVKSW